MSINFKPLLISCTVLMVLASCGTIEKASVHGLNSGFYNYSSEKENSQKVYLDVTEEKIDIYGLVNDQPDKDHYQSFSFEKPDSFALNAPVFKKQSLDIDITSILLKYRPAVHGSQAQLTADLNIALYTGWRFDSYRLVSRKDPLGKSYTKINSRGFDFGVFAGPGTTVISPFTTQNLVKNEYSGMIIQTGIAGFIESDYASFGFAIGYDHLLSPDRNVWIFTNKPWLGFIVGVALN